MWLPIASAKTLMSLKTINRKSIRLELTDRPLATGVHLTCHFTDISSKGDHECVLLVTRGKWNCWPWKCSALLYTFNYTETNNLTWLHKSGHWALCGEDHWWGYRPVQSHYWCLGRRDRVKKHEQCIRNMRQTGTERWEVTSHTVTYLSSIYPLARSESQCQCDTRVCSLSLQWVWIEAAHQTLCHSAHSLKYCAVSSAAGSIAQQLNPSPKLHLIKYRRWHLTVCSETLRRFDKVVFSPPHLFIMLFRENQTKIYSKVLFDVYISGESF